MTVVAVWDLQNVSVTGTPFASNATADSHDVGTFLTINGPPIVVDVSDDDGYFEDADGSQTASEMTLGGVTYAAGSEAENEYSYVLRPVGGATDGSDDIIVYAFEVEGDVMGIAATDRLVPGVTYEIMAEDSNDPSVAYSALYVCFAAGQRIATPEGACRVEALRAGDPVWTQNGAQPLIWAGQSHVPAMGAQAAIQFGPKACRALGFASKGIRVSPQHRMIWPSSDRLAESRLVPARAFLGWQDVTRCPKQRQHYVHLMLDHHALLEVEGVWSESFNPGPQALRALAPADRLLLMARYPSVTTSRVFKDVCPVEKVGSFRRRLGLAPLAGGYDLEPLSGGHDRVRRSENVLSVALGARQ
ncbi:MAG: Hint domain-containing protein [Rhodobacteraceae bacterium]|nr:Hint domain-containing protein [Paracoccaceae bacterium]